MSTTNEFDYKKYLILIGKNKKLFVITALVIMTVITSVSYFLPRKYEANSTVFIEKSVISDLVKGIAVTPSMEDKIKVLNYAITSRTLLLKVIDDLDLNVNKQNDAQLEELVAKFQKNTVIKLKNDENFFIISFTNENPRLARDYVNTLVRRYIEENVSSKREESYGATKFLSEQIEVYKEKMDKAEAEVNNFKTGKMGVIATDPAILQKEINDAQQKIDDMRLKLAQVESLRNQIKKNNPLQQKMLSLQKKLDDMLVEYTESYPEVIRLKTELHAVKEQLRRSTGSDMSPAETQDLDRVEAEIKALKASVANQHAIISSNRSLLHNIPVAKATLDQLEREKNNQKNLYEQLVARHGQSEVSKQMEVQDKATTFRIVDPAIMPINPVSPNRVNIILMGIGAGLVSAFCLLILLDHLDQSVKTVDALKSFGLPILAIIPKMQNPAELLLQKKRDVKLYVIAGVYFSLILTVLLIEVLNSSLSNTFIDSIQIKQYLPNLMSQFKYQGGN